MIIRPATGTGNKVIVQDQAGAAVLTTADSGATVANATLNAPTVADMTNCTFPAGHVIQVLTGTYATESYTTSVSFASMSLAVTITPKSASSKFFIICNTSGYNNSGNAQIGFYTIYRDSTNLGPANGYANVYQGVGNANDDLGTNICISELDSPNTTSSIIYGMYARTNNASYRTYWSMNHSKSDITVMEVAG